ncbi:MAG TPA: hypothetical protein PKV80_16295, partial [Leptospiraceae bacterium]|nr:hypothetical protein [Leptospiraceae bacterium]HNF26031.1 hypothetical protein [Leptospiraceae bacterium]
IKPSYFPAPGSQTVFVFFPRPSKKNFNTQNPPPPPISPKIQDTHGKKPHPAFYAESLNNYKIFIYI